MIITILRSSSKGNCTVIKTAQTLFLIDIGISKNDLLLELENINYDIDKIKYLIITHTHTDHISGLKQILKKNITVVTSQTIYEELIEKNYIINDCIILNSEMLIDDLLIEPFKSSHDAKECLGFVFRNNNQSLGFVTDTGYINQINLSKLKDLNTYIIESNYDEQMLIRGNYPYKLKQRIRSDKGHLSNEDCLKYLKIIIGPQTEEIYLIHLSQENNLPKLAYDNIYDNLIKDNDNIKLYVTSPMGIVKELVR